MRVAKHWACVSVLRKHTDFDFPLRHLVWAPSDESEDAARAIAAARAAELQRRPIDGANWKPRENQIDSDYTLYPRWTAPEPMLDDVVTSDGTRAAAITINRYGCEVLNTVDLAFIDIDNPETITSGLGLLGALKSLFAPGKAPSPNDATTQRTTDKLDQWTGANTNSGARLYKTAAGLRIMLIAPAFDPTASATADLMRSFEADSDYIRFCRQQECFRARLTPKPWRVGIDRIKVRYTEYRDGDADLFNWLTRYHEACEHHATCRLIHESGSLRAADADPDTARLVDLHDTATKTHTDLPLA